ncbi:Na+/H+ antiporter subunit E [Clostridium thermarum]|uniref:Na+/H+ antiporter subunit E n=1 Tax=Clostridium thermarum TaxID=1716543 RepID=UPI0011223C83|nr:Na+/H+ antiporter subunit E [Clostridium thermarum]
MKKLMAVLSTFILCFLMWVLFTGAYSNSETSLQEYIGGAVVSLLVAYFSSAFLISEKPFWLFNPKRFGAFLLFCLLYIWELLKANWDVAKRALSPKLNINPGIVKIETELKSDYGLAMLANCITLTPGTITMDIVEENGKCYMYIHWIDVATRDMKEASDTIKGVFEPWVRRIFK